MEKKWCRYDSTGWTAQWPDKCDHKLRIGAAEYFTPEEAESLANWILETLPKKRYKINKTFEFKPDYVAGYVHDEELYPYTNNKLTKDEVEEIWE